MWDVLNKNQSDLAIGNQTSLKEVNLEMLKQGFPFIQLCSNLLLIRYFLAQKYFSSFLLEHKDTKEITLHDVNAQKHILIAFGIA